MLWTLHTKTVKNTVLFTLQAEEKQYFYDISDPFGTSHGSPECTKKCSKMFYLITKIALGTLQNICYGCTPSECNV
jgi:hypothetical protein